MGKMANTDDVNLPNLIMDCVNLFPTLEVSRRGDAYKIKIKKTKQHGSYSWEAYTRDELIFLLSGLICASQILNS